ncbi:MAG: cell division protein FtsQ/DivIB [Planctomycetota bacterium]|jgi:hypothetical protein
MAGKKAKRKKKGILFGFGAGSGRRKRRAGPWRRRITAVSIITAVILAAVCVFAALGAGFMFLEQYVKTAVPLSRKIGSLELLGVPTWVNNELEKKICTAAHAGAEDLTLSDDTARFVQNNLVRNVAWLDRVRVQTTNNSIRIRTLWRKPLSLVQLGSRRFYVDKDLVILDFVPVAGLAVVEVTGITGAAQAPAPGRVWRKDDLAAAIDILARLERMDRLLTPDKPLLYEIDSIDVSNFNGRQSSRDSHIVLYSKDNTEIIWGAEIGTWQHHLEATDEEKLAKLYAYYKESGTLLNGAKYVNLRDPQQTIPLPVDRY